MSFKDISIYSSGNNFVEQCKNICTVLVEGIMRNITVKLF